MDVQCLMWKKNKSSHYSSYLHDGVREGCSQRHKQLDSPCLMANVQLFCPVCILGHHLFVCHTNETTDRPAEKSRQASCGAFWKCSIFKAMNVPEN